MRRELFLGIGALVALNLLLAFGAIGLLVRMGPAIERILQDNVYSIVAAEEILAKFANAGDTPLSSEDRTEVLRFLTRARTNVTVDEELRALAIVEESLPRAMDGDAQARWHVVRELRKTIRINREAMRGVDDEARRLSSAGAWTAVLIGTLSFLLSLFVVMRLQRRIIKPLADLHDVLEGTRHGNRLRRCRLTDAPREIIQVAQSVNHLLDERLRRT